MSDPAEIRLDGDFFYRLVPILYRVRDQQLGQPLYALLAVLESQYRTLDANLRELYDDWFIATCAEWVVPYLGEILGLDPGSNPRPWHTWRSLVATTLADRRRKGTAGALARAAANASGWPALPVASEATLGATQSLARLTPLQGRTLDLRDATALSLLATPFDATAHTAALSPLPPAANLPQVTLYYWRLQSYPVDRGNPFAVGPGCYTFHPLGRDTQLYNVGRTQEGAAEPPRAIDLPIAVSRARLAAILKGAAAGRREALGWLADPPVLALFLGPGEPPVPPGEIHVGNLESWAPPPPGSTIAVDPELGRLTLRPPPGHRPPALSQIAASWAYALAGDVGGGPYYRSGPDPAWEWGRGTFHALVSRHGSSPPFPDRYSTLDAALAAWQESGESGTIEIADSATYRAPAGRVELTQERKLAITASQGECPSVLGDWEIASDSSAVALLFDGLVLGGEVRLAGYCRLAAADCTVAALRVEPGALDAEIRLERVLAGPLAIAPTALSVTLRDCVVDAGSGVALGSPAGVSEVAPAATIERCTVFGRVHVAELDARAAIFMGRVYVRRREVGEVQFSWVPPGSATPRQYRCQPSLALQGVTDPARRKAIVQRLRPVFTSTVYGQPGYAQLGRACAGEIRTGTADGSEMGVFHNLFQAGRREVLDQTARDYLPWTLDVAPIPVT